MLFRQKVIWRNHMPEPRKAEGLPVKLEEREPLKEEANHFLECIRTGNPPRTDFGEAVRVLRVLERATLSLNQGAETLFAQAGG